MRHSKFRNTGILFEVLAKQVTADIIANNTKSPAKNILHKYFNENSELGKEWQLYNTLLSEKIKDQIHAERLLSVVLESRKKINYDVLLEQKYNLIKDLKGKYPLEEMFKTPVKNYRTLASIYKLFEDICSDDVKFDVKEVYQAKNCIIEHIVDKPKVVTEEEDIFNYYKNQPEEIRLLSWKLLVEKLNNKYKNTLNEEQKSILREYICNVSNTNSFGEFVKRKATDIKESLAGLVDKVNDSNVIKIKINEVINQLNKIDVNKIVRDNHVTVLMLSCELIKELKDQTSK